MATDSGALRRFLFVVLAVVFTSAAFHALGLLGAPLQIVYSDTLGFYERAASPGYPYIGKNIEYPVLTGVFIDAMARIGGSRPGYYAATSVFLAAFAAVIAWLLWRMTPADGRGRLRRYFAFAPSLFVFAAYNWDLLALLFVVAAFYVMERRRFAAAAFFLALGFSAKFYPVIYFLPLWLAQSSWKERGKTLAIFAATAIAVNLPFLLANTEGWSYFFTLNSARNANPDSIWTIVRFFFRGLEVPAINAISLSLFVGGYGWALWRFRGAAERGLVAASRPAPALWLCFLGTLILLLTNKVFSPQYILWLLPFFVLLPAVTRWQFYALEGANLAALFFILPWFFLGKDIFYFYLASPFVLARHVVLVILLIAAVRTLSRREQEYLKPKPAA
ncbi:MAG: DUF2029 domain-containing protein [Candidatus Sungbacteria bacterium]|uniref:DUF2029 domain-containing protein n=1 Tax=Candidatus Sungiibacteriota bacterium TaxID=2750080 RepID=A0A932YWF5_9BACT|nr:DUF2029 domain-containing protein [Candidatus Sungbacteria bacterium]